MQNFVFGKEASCCPELYIFTEELIDAHPDIAAEVLGFSSKFSIPLGWHYLLDLTWILSRLPVHPPARILDAGGGNGLLQYILATLGYAVVSVDAAARTPQADMKNSIPVYCSGFMESQNISYAVFTGKACASIRDAASRPYVKGGEIEFHCCDIANLQFLETGEFDAVVSVSALEHNPPETLPQIMDEIRRVTKSSAPMLLTISTSMTQETALHEASHSWLLTEQQIAALYQVPEAYSSNFSDIADLSEKLADSPRLNRWLAKFYCHSDKNGMPWGRWNPQYLPMGIFIKNIRPEKNATDKIARILQQMPQAIKNVFSPAGAPSLGAPGMPILSGYAAMLQKEAERLHGREVYFWGMGDIYKRNKGLFTHTRPRCILVDIEGAALPDSVDGLPVRHPQDVLPSGESLPTVVFVQNINAVYKTIQEQYPAYTDLVFVPY